MALMREKLKLSLYFTNQKHQEQKREPQNLRPAAHGFSVF
jgi:hypothetical protein